MLCGLGTLYLRNDDPRRALGPIEECLRANETYMDAWFLYGQTNEALGDLDRARMGYRKQLEFVPEHQFARMCLRNLEPRQGRRTP
mgnify:CR=1 FL=1